MLFIFYLLSYKFMVSCKIKYYFFEKLCWQKTAAPPEKRRQHAGVAEEGSRSGT